jgi:hypothetical protein
MLDSEVPDDDDSEVPDIDLEPRRGAAVFEPTNPILRRILNFGSLRMWWGIVLTLLVLVVIKLVNEERQAATVPVDFRWGQPSLGPIVNVSPKPRHYRPSSKPQKQDSGSSHSGHGGSGSAAPASNSAKPRPSPTPTPTATAAAAPEQSATDIGVNPMIDGAALDCTYIEKLVSRPELPDPANYRALAPVCLSSMRDQLTAKVAAGFEAQYASLSKGTGFFKEAYVSFAFGMNYGQLAYWALRAGMEFSQRPVLMFASGELAANAQTVWPPAQFPRLVVFEMPSPRLHAWFDKLRASLMAPVDRGVIIESDTLITPHADRLFKILTEHGGALPLMPGHADVRWPHCAGYVGIKECSNTFGYPVEKRTMDYVHAHLMWTAATKPFLAHILADCGDGGKSGQLDCSSDEAALNYALWNAKATKQLCFMDPHYFAMDVWEAESYDVMERSLIRQFTHRTIAHMFIHGAKEPHIAESLVKRIKALPPGKNWISNPPGGTKWTNSVEATELIENCIL